MMEKSFSIPDIKGEMDFTNNQLPNKTTSSLCARINQIHYQEKQQLVAIIPTFKNCTLYAYNG